MAPAGRRHGWVAVARIFSPPVITHVVGGAMDGDQISSGRVLSESLDGAARAVADAMSSRRSRMSSVFSISSSVINPHKGWLTKSGRCRMIVGAIPRMSQAQDIWRLARSGLRLTRQASMTGISNSELLGCETRRSEGFGLSASELGLQIWNEENKALTNRARSHPRSTPDLEPSLRSSAKLARTVHAPRESVYLALYFATEKQPLQVMPSPSPLYNTTAQFEDPSSNTDLSPMSGTPTVTAPAPSGQPPSTAKALASSNDGEKNPDPIIQIYQKLNQLFGNKEKQIFTMESPGRILDMGSYSYKESTGLEAQISDHRIRHYLGLLDIESSAEALLRAKEALRASKMRSVDDTEDIYPVQLSPASWGNYLTTDFEPVDLLMDQDAIIDYVINAQNQRNELVRRLSILQSGKQDAKTLEKEVGVARDRLTKAKEEMLKGLTENAATFVNLYVAKITKVKDFDEKKLKETIPTKWNLDITPQEVTQIKDGLDKVITQRDNYDAAMDKYSRILGEVASAEASNPEVAISQLKAQIEALSASISTHSSILQAVRDPKTGGSSPNVVPPNPKKGASQWQSIIVRYDSSKRDDTSQQLQSSSTVQAHAGGWFWSAQYNQDKSKAEDLKKFNGTNTSVDLAMNVMKVQISRPWLDASIFNQSNAYVRISDKKFSTGFDTKLVSSQNEKPPTGGELQNKFAEAEDSLLPAYPVAFIVAKDVTIKLTSSTEAAASLNTIMKESMSGGGSCLGFSVAAAGQSSSHTQSAYSAHENDTVSMKIPGPQIIGWIVQCTPEDACSTDYHRIDAEQFKVGYNASAEPEKNGKERK
ncbi:hypothetical protein M407DRAFT_4299 [Tulasnella calospora MUT 4182]|uniref:Uncharacterized protein n=1 Tax=Tulasnella calospora MUT 4182 TaxID=1051891 RepID=A0A0C3QK50_9AGAM|nr:hypothetical protein M407DRAFT_4299 [Tulasnella calospora MUT 4182]